MPAVLTHWETTTVPVTLDMREMDLKEAAPVGYTPKLVFSLLMYTCTSAIGYFIVMLMCDVTLSLNNNHHSSDCPIRHVLYIYIYVYMCDDEYTCILCHCDLY